MATYLSVIIPVFNSEKSLGELYRRLSAVLKRIAGENYEIIMVDDASRDESFLKMQALHSGDPKVKLIRLSRNFGQQNALLSGFHYAAGEVVITLDDDLQHPPEEIPLLIEKIEAGYDVVFGIPAAKKHSFYRNLGTVMTDCLLTLISRKTRNVKVSSFRALKRTVVMELTQVKRSFIYLAPLIFKVTTCTANVFVRHEPRRYGGSNYSFRKLFRLWVKLLMNYSRIAEYLPKDERPQFEIREIHF